MSRVLSLAVAVLLALPGAAGAQHWAKRAVCDVPEAAIWPEVLEPDGLAALEQVARTRANGTGRFWRITAPGGQVSHLWGTYHSADPLILNLPAEVLETIRTARVVALETDAVFEDRRHFEIAATGTKRFRPLGKPMDIEKLGLPEEMVGWIRGRGRALGLSSDVVNYMTLGGLAEMVMLDPCEDFASGSLPIQDNYIQTLAMIAGIPVIGLEPKFAFLDQLNKVGNEALAVALIATSAGGLEPRTVSKERATTFALYLQGRIGVVFAWDAAFQRKILGDRAEDLEALADSYLFDERNLTFRDRALPELRRGGVFIAVGAGHLSGDGGLVELFRAEGFDVERIVLPGEAEE